MVIGFTMIKVRSEQKIAAYNILRKELGIMDIFQLYGEFNFFLIIECESRGILNQLINDVRNMDFVSEVGPLMIASDIWMQEMTLGISLEPKCSSNSSLIL